MVGYHWEVLTNNTAPSYEAGQTFFTVFGVFFPSGCGIFGGINMSGNLRNPAKDIPLGTLAAVGIWYVALKSF